MEKQKKTKKTNDQSSQDFLKVIDSCLDLCASIKLDIEKEIKKCKQKPKKSKVNT